MIALLISSGGPSTGSGEQFTFVVVTGLVGVVGSPFG